MLTKIMSGIAAIGVVVGLFFRGQAFKSKAARAEDREKVKDKAHKIQRKSTDARHAGEKNERKGQSQPIDYEKPDDHF